MAIWEYLVVQVDERGYFIDPDQEDLSPDSDYREHLNELGQDGWELVAIGNWQNGEAPAFFKRPIE